MKKKIRRNNNNNNNNNNNPKEIRVDNEEKVKKGQ